MRDPIAGVDEVGRGPLAGPVVAAAVVLDPARPIPGIRDSKQLTAAAREDLAVRIRRLGRAELEEIDALNILRASLLAMARAVAALPIRPGSAWVDGPIRPSLPCAAIAVVKGDQLVPAIGATSILAKIARDAEMVELDAHYPGYGSRSTRAIPLPPTAPRCSASAPPPSTALVRAGVAHGASIADVSKHLSGGPFNNARDLCITG